MRQQNTAVERTCFISVGVSFSTALSEWQKSLISLERALPCLPVLNGWQPAVPRQGQQHLQRSVKDSSVNRLMLLSRKQYIKKTQTGSSKDV